MKRPSFILSGLALFVVFSVPAFAELSLDDVQITTTTLAPLLDSVKDNFKAVLPVLIILIALRLGAWLLPILVSAVSPNKH